MAQFNEPSPSPRENRLGTGIAFGGKVCELRDAQKCGCINAANRSFNQTYGCQFTLSLGMLNTLRKAVIVMHGPIGCGATAVSSVGTSQSLKRLRDPNAEGVVWLNTNLDEIDVINGGERKLREAIAYADKEFRPEAILIPISCVPSLIGDDVDAIIDDMQGSTSAAIIPVHCAGFKTKVMATAYDDVYHGILRGLIRKPVRLADSNALEDENYEIMRRYKDSHTVNILNVGSMSRTDELELERLLNAIGLFARFVPCYSDPQALRELTEAALNVSVCGTHDDYFIENIANLFGIPFLIDVMPIGRTNTARWLIRIAEHFGLEEEAKKVCELEDKQLDEAFEQFRPALKGKKVFLAGGEIRIVATAQIIQDQGMEIVGFKGHHYDEFAEPHYDSLKDIDDVIFNVATQTPFEQINLVRKLKPDLYIGHSGGGNVTSKQGLPLFPLFATSSTYFGYTGAFEIARRIARVIKNGQFNKKIAENRPLPYRKEWLEAEDPFRYIKDKEYESENPAYGG